MRCVICGSEEAPHERRGSYLFDQHGLQGELLNVRFTKCPGCEDESVDIPAMEKLLSIVAEFLVLKTGKLTGDEVRFLRKYAGFSSSDFAEIIGVAPATLSRWEHGKQPIDHGHEHTIRLIGARGVHVEDYHLYDALRAIDGVEVGTRPARRTIRLDDGDWRPTAA